MSRTLFLLLLNIQKVNNMAEITIYSKPNCVQCNATYQALDRKSISYQIIDLTEDSQALELVRKLGYQQVPVVIAGDKHWAGFRPDMISLLAA
ncbi:glutaredoxin [Providencia rettgeri DSM 1131]|jgi:glutaredoxin-like protein NrdH|nr:glutaredoxin [Providencia rettgeri DSM 1131]